MTTTKEFETRIFIDWKSGKFRLASAKRKTLKEKPTEIPILLSLEIEIPDKPSLKAVGKISLSEEKIQEIVLEAL